MARTFPLHRPARVVSMLLGAGLGSVFAGCSGGDKGAPLTAEQFAARNGVPLDIDGGRAAGQPVDRAGAVPYDTTERLTPRPSTPSEVPEDPNPRPDQRTVAISPAIKQAVSRPSEDGAVANTNSTTQPASPRPVALPPGTRPANGGGQPVVGGQAIGVFFVVMEVNGQPIFSDKVLQTLERPLSAEAKVNKVEVFRNIAQAYIEREVLKFMNNELEIAAAEKALDKDDRQLAKGITMQWRQKQITAAGGSLEMARRKARQEGWDFDEMVEQQNRFHLVQLYYQKHIAPLTKVAAADVRAYYQQNKDKEFSTPGKSKFRVIKIDLGDRKYASKADAIAAAEKVLERAKTEDFAKLASDASINDDAETNRERGGYVRNDGWVDAGSYPIDEVEKEVTSLKPGQVTPVIQARNALFIAKLEEVQDAKVKPFEDLVVQEAITEKLKAQQIQAMRERHVRDLQQTAVTVRKEGAMKSLLEIVMSRYPEWSGAKG